MRKVDHFVEMFVKQYDLWTVCFRYIPHDIVLDQFLKPFIPDYIPAIGDFDPMLKVCCAFISVELITSLRYFLECSNVSSLIATN